MCCLQRRYEDQKTLQGKKMPEGSQGVIRELPRRKRCLFFRYQKGVTMTFAAGLNNLEEINSVF